MNDRGTCAWPACNKTGNHWRNSKCYCKEHYETMMIRTMLDDDDSKPITGKAAIGAVTIPNEDSL